MAGELSILVAFGGGLFSFLSPCVLPLFPSYLSFITGMSLDQLQSAAGDARGRRWILANSLAFVVGFSMVFVGMGASFSALGQLLFDYRERIRLVGGILIIIFGLYVAGVLRLGFLGRYQQIQLRSKPAGLVGSWLVGVTFAIGWTPCVGPILGSILSLAGTADTVSTGVGLLVSGARGVPRRVPPVPPLAAGDRAHRGGAAGRGRRPRRDQLLHRPQLLRAEPHAPVAAQPPLGRPGLSGRDCPKA